MNKALELEAGLDEMAAKIQAIMDLAGEKGGEHYDGFLGGYKCGLAAAGMTLLEEHAKAEGEDIKNALMDANLIIVQAYVYAATV